MKIPRLFAAVALACAFAILAGCAGQPLKLPTLSPAQLQQLSGQVCAAVKVDLLLLQGPSGKALLPPDAQAKIVSTIAPTAAAVCDSGATVDLTSLQTFNSTVVPALIDIVAAVPAIPNQPAILAGLTLAQGILVPIVNQAIAQSQAAAATPAK